MMLNERSFQSRELAHENASAAGEMETAAGEMEVHGYATAFIPACQAAATEKIGAYSRKLSWGPGFGTPMHPWGSPRRNRALPSINTESTRIRFACRMSSGRSPRASARVQSKLSTTERG
jgi:hypothetical protein